MTVAVYRASEELGFFAMRLATARTCVRPGRYKGCGEHRPADAAAEGPDGELSMARTKIAPGIPARAFLGAHAVDRRFFD